LAGGSRSDVLDHAKETISNVADQAGDKVASQLDKQRDKAANGLGSIAQTLRQTSEQLRQQDDQAATHEYVVKAADQIERFSGYLRSTNVNQMVSNVEQFARRQPALFLGGAFVLGVIGARFLKSSGKASSGQSSFGDIPRDRSVVPRTDYPGAVLVPGYAQTSSPREGLGAARSGTAGNGSMLGGEDD